MLRRAALPALWLFALVLLSVSGPDIRELVHPDVLLSQLNASPDAVLGTAAAALTWGLLLWLAAGWLAVLGSSVRGPTGRRCRRLAAVLLPRTLRGLLESAVGLTVVLSAAPAALAAEPAPVATSAVAASPLPSLDRVPVTHLQLAPLPAVPAPVLAPAVAAHPPVLRGRAPDEPAEIVVHRGDCLWGVVARALGPDADDAAVAQAWPRWYEANRSVIGPDPGLLLPGQRLVAPEPAPAGR